MKNAAGKKRSVGKPLGRSEPAAGDGEEGSPSGPLFRAKPKIRPDEIHRIEPIYHHGFFSLDRLS